MVIPSSANRVVKPFILNKKEDIRALQRNAEGSFRALSSQEINEIGGSNDLGSILPQSTCCLTNTLEVLHFGCCLGDDSTMDAE
ncbi:MAG: hypothetical protein D6794_12030 [Deltaproteobacteria bacterium]|nr:MAG: hypothetical protein D6794_12030 [Deltaproteobacteria bacterium]